nr:carboxypeptidase-like regulatory domain-containing protein [bacterium]
MSKKYSALLTAVLWFAFNNASWAGITGKITGKVTDNQTGAPLLGANILLEGTSLGAVSDVSGLYVITNVMPGTYSVKFRMMGYSPTTVTNVIVYSDRIAKVDCGLKSTVIQGEEVVITATR